MNFLDFYINKEPDDKGRYFIDILHYDNNELKNTHDYIQRVFPLLEASECVANAPVITKEEVELIKKDKLALVNISKMYKHMLHFWKIDDMWKKDAKDYLNPENKIGCFEKMITIYTLKPHWISSNNHNYRRISRVIKSLTLFGLEKEVKDLKERLNILCEMYPKQIGNSKDYWGLEE